MQLRRYRHNLSRASAWVQRSRFLPALLLVVLCFQSALAAPLPTRAKALSETATVVPTTDAWSNFATFDGPVVDTIFTLHTAPDGYLWVGTTNGVSVRSPAGEWQTITMNDGLAGNRVTAIATDPTNPQRHWFATNGGASLLDDGGTPLDKSNDQWMTFGKRDGILDHRLSAVTVAPNGDLWFGLTYIDVEVGVRVGNGISVLKTNGTPFDKSDDQWSSFTAANSHLSTNVIHKLVTDDAGIIWVATQSGLNAYQNGQWQLFSMEQGLPANEVNTMVVVGHQLWVGTAKGFGILDYGAALADSSDDQWLTYTNATLSVPNISSLVLDSQGYLWVGSYDIPDDFYYFDDNYAVGNALVLDLSQTPFSMEDDQPMNIDSWQISAPRALAVQGNTLWAATRNGLRHLSYTASPFDQSQWQWQDDAGEQGLAGRRIAAITAFGADRMAMAVDGSPRLLFHAFTPHYLRDDTVVDLSMYAASSLATDSQQRLWLGSGESLLVVDLGTRLDDDYDDKIHEYSEMAGLAFDQINKIVIDGADRAWIANGTYLHGGLTLLSVGKEVTEIGDDQMATFTAQNSGLPGKYVTALALGKANDLWLGTNVGAAHLVYGPSPFAKGDDQWTVFTPLSSGIADTHIRDIAVDSVGNAWFALASGGVSVYTTGGEWVTFSESDGLLLNAVNAVTIDQAGQIWLGTDGEGLSVLNYGATIADKSDDQWTAYRPGAPLLSGYIQTLTVDPWGQVWVGTFGGGLSLYSATSFTQIRLPIIYQPYYSSGYAVPVAEAVPAVPVEVVPFTTLSLDAQPRVTEEK